jgi:hypothetical protein
MFSFCSNLFLVKPRVKSKISSVLTFLQNKTMSLSHFDTATNYREICRNYSSGNVGFNKIRVRVGNGPPVTMVDILSIITSSAETHHYIPYATSTSYVNFVVSWLRDHAHYRKDIWNVLQHLAHTTLTGYVAYLIGMCLFRGYGVKRDIATSRVWFCRAVSQQMYGGAFYLHIIDEKMRVAETLVLLHSTKHLGQLSDLCLELLVNKLL